MITPLRRRAGLRSRLESPDRHRRDRNALNLSGMAKISWFDGVPWVTPEDLSGSRSTKASRRPANRPKEQEDRHRACEPHGYHTALPRDVRVSGTARGSLMGACGPVPGQEMPHRPAGIKTLPDGTDPAATLD